MSNGTFKGGGGGGGGGYKSLAPYVVGDTNSDFTSIQPAIDASVLAGANRLHPVNIHIKPNAAGKYIEDLNMAPGVNLIGQGSASDSIEGSTFDVPLCPVLIIGTLTFPVDAPSQSRNIIENITFAIDGPPLTVFPNSTAFPSYQVFFNNCKIRLGNNSNSVVIEIGDTYAPSLIFNLCEFYDFGGSGALFVDSGISAIAGGIDFEFANTSCILNGTSTCSTVPVGINADFCPALNIPMTLTGTSSIGGGYKNCFLSGSQVYASVNSLLFTYCTISSTYDVAAAIGALTFYECSIQLPNIFTGAISGNLIGCSLYSCGYNNISQTPITSNYTTVVQDNVVLVDTTGGAVTITLYATPFIGMTQTVKDAGGDAGTNHITINGNGFDIDGAGTKTLATNFIKVTMCFNGTQWYVITGQIV